MESQPSRPLLALALLAALGACKRDDARMPTAAEATAPVGTSADASAVLSSAAEAVMPLSAKDEIGKAMDAFLEVRSFHVDMTTSTPKGDMAMGMDFVAPDRYRMKTPTGTQYVIGDTMYMTMNGQTTKMALPPGQIANYRDPAQFEANKATMTVESLEASSWKITRGGPGSTACIARRRRYVRARSWSRYTSSRPAGGTPSE